VRYIDGGRLNSCRAGVHVCSAARQIAASREGMLPPWRSPLPLSPLLSQRVPLTLPPIPHRLLSGRAARPLPPPAEMAAWVAAHEARVAAAGAPPKRTHYLGARQWAYHSWLAAACGPGVAVAPPGWRGAALRVFWVLLWVAEAVEGVVRTLHSRRRVGVAARKRNH
jgi:hypothetical protein